MSTARGPAAASTGRVATRSSLPTIPCAVIVWVTIGVNAMLGLFTLAGWFGRPTVMRRRLLVAADRRHALGDPGDHRHRSGVDLGRDRLPLSGRRRPADRPADLRRARRRSRLGRVVARSAPAPVAGRHPTRQDAGGRPGREEVRGIVVHASSHRARFDAVDRRARRAPDVRRPPRADGVPRASPARSASQTAARCSSSSSTGTGTSVGTRHTSRRIVSEWCETLRCRSRSSAKLIRRDGIGRPPSAATAFSALPLASALTPHVVSVPRFPGPSATTITSAPSTSFAASMRRPDGHGLELAAERLSARDPPVDQPGIPELEHRPGERAGQRGAVRHDVHDACVARPLGAGGDRSEHRVQRGAHDRRLLQPDRTFDELTVGLLDARHGGLRAGCSAPSSTRPGAASSPTCAPSTATTKWTPPVPSPSETAVVLRITTSPTVTGPQRSGYAIAVARSPSTSTSSSCAPGRASPSAITMRASQADHAGPRSVHTAPL